MTKKTDKLHEMIRGLAEELVAEEMKAVVAERAVKQPAKKSKVRAAFVVQPRTVDDWKPDPKWKATFKVCPACKRSKVVWNGGDKAIEDFGVRRLRGVERSQPWCRKCRSTTNYHSRPRKNRSVNNPG